MKFIDMINEFLADPNADKNAILVFIDIAFQMNFITTEDKDEFLSILGVTSYNIEDVIDSIVPIYESRNYLDYLTLNLALRKYARLGVITIEKRDYILSLIEKK